MNEGDYLLETDSPDLSIDEYFKKEFSNIKNSDKILTKFLFLNNFYSSELALNYFLLSGYTLFAILNFALLLILFWFNMQLYYSNNSKEMSIKIIDGYPKFDLYKRYLNLIFTTTLISSIIILFLELNILFAVLIIIIEVLLLFIFHIKVVKKSIINILKGEN